MPEPLQLVLSVLAAVPEDGAGGEPSPWLRFLGRLHPLLVHFPIGLLLAAGLLELLRRGGGGLEGRPTRDPAVVMLLLGAAGAVLAASTGWLNGELERHGSSVATTLSRHRWTGIATAVVSCAAAAGALAHARGGGSGARALHRLGLLVSVALVGYGSHLGGTLVFGSGYLLDVFRDRGTATVPTEPGPAGTDEGPGEVDKPATDGAPADASPTDAPSPGAEAAEADFLATVRPILEARCFKCHGEKRSKGDLRLHDIELAFEGDPAAWVIRPGDPEESELYRRISLPHDDLDLMPAEGDPLTPEEIERIRRWIEEGAPR